MIAILGTEVAGNGGQVIEIVLITAEDDYTLKKIYPTFVIKRDVDRSMDPDRYELYSKNGLLDVADVASTTTNWVEEAIVSVLPAKIGQATQVFFSEEDLQAVNDKMPVLFGRLSKNVKIVAVDESQYRRSGRALEDAIEVLGQMKREASH